MCYLLNCVKCKLRILSVKIGRVDCQRAPNKIVRILNNINNSNSNSSNNINSQTRGEQTDNNNSTYCLAKTNILGAHIYIYIYIHILMAVIIILLLLHQYNYCYYYNNYCNSIDRQYENWY